MDAFTFQLSPESASLVRPPTLMPMTRWPPECCQSNEIRSAPGVPAGGVVGPPHAA